MQQDQSTARDYDLRWARAASWANGQSLGPYGRVPSDECEQIERLRDLILWVGEEKARVMFEEEEVEEFRGLLDRFPGLEDEL